MGQLREIDTLRMKRRQKEVEANKTRDKLRALEEDIKTYDKRIVSLQNSDGSGGFGRLDI